MSISFPKETHSRAEVETLYRSLLESDDTTLFTKGGCHIFAQALHEEFRYQIRYIPGHQDIGGISHIYCFLDCGARYAIDVIGTSDEYSRVVDDFHGLGDAPFIHVDELKKLYSPPAERGCFAESWFAEPAFARARDRIERFRPYFDGSKKETIPNP